MKHIFPYIISLAALAASCNSQEMEPSVRYGTLSVALEEPEIVVQTKTGTLLDKNSDEAAKYTVRVFDSSDVQQYTSTYKDFTAQTLPFGIYYVTAENCTEAEAEDGNGEMRLFGQSTNVTLSKDYQNQTATVTCEVTNAMFTVSFDADAKKHIDNLQVVLTKGTRILTITETDVNTETWFNPGTVSYTISGTFNGNSLELKGSKELNAKDDVKLHVKVNMENGELLAPDVSFQASIENVEDKTEGFNPYQAPSADRK